MAAKAKLFAEIGLRKHKLEVIATGRRMPATRHFHRWLSMMQRCENPKNKSYAGYGGRGITVCQEWRDPKTFCDWVDQHLGACPAGHSIDRVDNDGNYEPSNVKWSTASEQASNRRKAA